MLFVTNRTPVQSSRSKTNRKISFDSQNTAVSQYLFFCERKNKDDYVEIRSFKFFEKLKSLPQETQLLLFIHGFNTNMEPNVFETSQMLQELFDQKENGLVYVVPLIWPCDDDSILAFAGDYWDDQDAADASGPAFCRMLGKFDAWRKDKAQQDVPCFRRMNVLAHSMGNRVLKNALKDWSEKHSSGEMPMLFRNTFMFAPDIKNEELEKGKDGQYIVDASRNLVVYYAGDDFAMPASKVANIRHKRLSRRLGMTGPEDISILPKNVYEVDCGDFNNRFDSPLGHAYFLKDKDGIPSPTIDHMVDAIKSGRINQQNRSIRLDNP